MMKNTVNTSIRKAAALALAGSLTLGVGAAFAEPALAQESTTTQPGESAREDRGQARLDALVEAGIISQEQADQIRTYAEERRAERQADRQANREALAATLGLTADELKTALQSGSSLADLAAEAGVDVNTIIDQLMAPRLERLAEAVADGRIDQAEADERAAAMRERVTARVNGEAPEGGHGGRGGHGSRGGHGGHGGRD